jgi:hypothetical protein
VSNNQSSPQTYNTKTNTFSSQASGDKYSLNLTASEDPIVKMQQELLNYSSELKRPYMEWGDDTMRDLKTMVSDGAFLPDGSQVENFQFKELTDDFNLQEYGQQRPEITRFQAGQAPELYDPGQAYTSQDQAPQFQTGDVYQRPEFQDTAQRPEYSQTAQRPEDYQRPEYHGRDVMTDYQAYEGTEAPQARKITTDFQTGQYQSGESPDVYRAGEAPEAEYYTPPSDVAKAYQAGEFKVEDDPGYNRRYERAMKALEASGAAKGQQLSGATLKRLQEEAAAIASEETAAAYDRYADNRNFEASQEREDYQRGQTQEDRVASAMNYKNEDEYQRYLDNVGIRRDEQQKYIDQWNKDRDFGASQNKENWTREMAEKELGRSLNDDEFNRWLQTEGKNYAQYADQRDWTTSQTNKAADQDWNKYTYGTTFDYGSSRDKMGDYKDDRSFEYGQYRDDMGDYRDDQTQDWNKYTYNTGFDATQSDKAYDRSKDKYLYDTDAYRWGEDQKTAAEQENYNRRKTLYGDKTAAYQYDTNLAFNADQNYQNMKQGAYSEDKADYYNLQDNKWQQNLGNLDRKNLYQTQQYGQAQDVYNMDAANKSNRYGTLRDIVGLGLTAQNAAIGQGGDYTNFMTDWNVNQQNRKDALKSQKSDNWWNAANLFSNILT